MSHTLEKLGPKHFRCTVCHQEWQAPSKAYCPGLPVIPYSRRGTLMDKTELKRRGYKTDVLPEVTCCYRLNNHHGDVYISLYDSTQCQKANQRKHRTVHYVDSLPWPVAWMSVIENLMRFGDGEFDRQKTTVWYTRCHEIASMAAELVHYTPDEIQQMAGETVICKFDRLQVVRMDWRMTRRHTNESMALVTALINTYLRWKAGQPLTDEEMERRAKIRAKIEAENLRREAEAKAKRDALFQGPNSLVPPDDGPAPRQRSLFGDITP